MTSTTTKPDLSQPEAETAVDLFDDWFDPIETEVRDRVREFIEELIRGELDAALARPRYGRQPRSAGDEGSSGVAGHRHGSRTRSLTGTFGPIEIAVPRARLNTPEGKTTEWKSQALRAYQRRTLAADALIAEHLSRRHQHAPGAPRARGAVRRRGRQGHGEPGLAQGEERLGRLERPLAGRRADRAADPRRHGGARAARPQGDLDLAARRDRRARRTGRRCCWRSRAWAARATEAWRTVLDDLIARGLRRPEFLIVDGAPGLEKAIAAVWDGVPVQRCTVHKHRNLLAHAPERLHEEITADYNDMIYAATPRGDRGAAQGLHPQVAAQAPRRRRQPGGSRRPPVHLHPAAAEPMAQRAHHECDRAAARGVQATDQDADRAAVGRHRRHAVLGAARLRPDQHAQGRWLADARHKAHRSAN